MRRALAVVLLAVLLALSGCSLLGGSTPTPTPTDASTPASPTVSPTPTTDPTATPAPYPPGYGERGVVDADRAVDAHAASMLDRESFIVEYNGSAFTGDRLATINSLQTVNLSTDRAYVITTVGGRGTTTQYFADGKAYVRDDPPGDNNTDYSSRDSAFQPRDYTGVGLVGPLVRNVDYGAPERVQRRGGTFFRYRSSNVTAVQPILGDNVEPENVTEMEVGIVVGPSGIVHRGAYSATVERGDETLQIRVEVNSLGFRSTTVSPPDWLAKAE